MQKLRLVVISSILVACSDVIQKPENLINQLEVQNYTSGPVKNFRLKVQDNGNIFACGYIPEKASCSIGFPERERKNRSVEFAWEQSGQEFQYLLKTALPDLQKADDKSKVVVVVLDKGELKIGLQ